MENKAVTYRYFQRQNDTLKAHTPANIVGHLEDIDFEKGTLSLAVGKNKATQTITELVEAIVRQAGCVSNPSALESWKGFKPVEIEVKRHFKIARKKIDDNLIETYLVMIIQKGDKSMQIAYPMGDLDREKLIWESMNISIDQGLKMKIKAFDRYLEYKGISMINPMENQEILDMFKRKERKK